MTGFLPCVRTYCMILLMHWTRLNANIGGYVLRPYHDNIVYMFVIVELCNNNDNNKKNDDGGGNNHDG